jgi:hypothetical protein
MRGIRRFDPQLAPEVARLFATIKTIELTRVVMLEAEALAPTTLRTLDALHLASALLLGPELEAFVAYDTRLLEAAAAHDIPTASPG